MIYLTYRLVRVCRFAILLTLAMTPLSAWAGPDSTLTADTTDPLQARTDSVVTAVDSSVTADSVVSVSTDTADTIDTSALGVLSLEDCVTLALAHNLQHQSNLRQFESTREQLRRAKAPFELNADANLTLPNYRDERDTFESEALTSRFRAENTRFIYSGQLQLSQRIPHAGRVSITSNTLRNDFSSNRSQDFLEYFGDVQFGYRHEILNRADEEIQLRRAELNYDIGRTNVEFLILNLEARTTNSFYDLVQGVRQLDIQKQRLEQSTAALDLAKRKFEIGLIAEVQALRLEVEKLRAEAAYAQAATSIEGQRDALRQMLGMEMSDPLEIATDVSYTLYPVDETTAVGIGLTRRTDMAEALIRNRISELDVELTKKRVGPSATLNTSVSLRGRGEDPGEVGSTFERNLVSARIDVQLPLLDGGDRRGTMRQAEIGLERSKLSEEQIRRQVIREVRQAVRSVQEAERQIGLREKAQDVAERTFDVENSRFELGLADSQQLLDAQTDLTQARTDALNAIISYQRSLQDLRLATMAEPYEVIDFEE
ncbi:MAG: TolC family protein [Gemmatimonadetes bacterium]|jgi:outer membrane protein|nr:TolC family protein [Gemmatimonadota bacterium]MBT5964196.1 TolC family protein [Gemmatimonadota bacterium]